MNTAGTYVDYVLPVCQYWPTYSNPSKPEDVVIATQWSGGITMTPCEWRHDKAIEHGIVGAPPKGHIMIRIPIGMTRSWGAKQNLKYMFCKTHNVHATKVYVKNSGFQSHVTAMLKQWWKITSEPAKTPNGYNTWVLKATRKILIDTMRKMW